MSEEQKPNVAPVKLYPIAGREFMVKACGKRSHNGSPFNATVAGSLSNTECSCTVWDILREIIDHAEIEFSKMEHVGSIQINLLGPESKLKILHPPKDG